MKPYRLLAEHYDEFLGAYDPRRAAARERALGPALRTVRSACDLACGTGTTAVELARRGIDVVAVDLSATMCALARRKAAGAGVRLRVVRADMRAFRLPSPVDLVTCEFDALNHVPDRADLLPTFGAVARALRPGGWFYFDVNTRQAFAQRWRGAAWHEAPGVVLVMRAGYDRDADRAFTDAEWFLKEGHRWRRVRERVEEVCWTPAEIRGALRQAGFGTIRAHDAAALLHQPAGQRGCRTFYVARKAARAARPAR